MKIRTLKQKAGIYITVLSLLLLITDRTTGILSTFIGKQICGEKYLCPVGGVVCDRSCGFNTDMYVLLSLGFMMILGMALLFSAEKEIAE